ncbi:hypothetical protein CMK11_14155 [Candidatus Poribacteria bacterium]|nr:hypothetical protein [Candidatus Poribacteria bacterium]
MPGAEDRRPGVFQDLARRRANVARARWKTGGALVLGGVGLVGVALLLPLVRVRGVLVPMLMPLAWASIGVCAVIGALKAVSRLITGKYRTGRTDFGLPTAEKQKDDDRDTLT